MKSEIFVCADCGKKITIAREGCSFNYAIKQNGNKVCNDCALKEEIRHIENDEKVFAYLSGDCKRITDWKGNTLAKVTWSSEIMHNWARKLMCINATTNNGRKLYGRGSGGGIYIRLRPVKLKTSKQKG